MAYEIDYTDLAKADISYISEYLSNFYSGTLERFLNFYNKRISILHENPYAFKVCNFNPQYRQVSVADYIVMYTVNEAVKSVEIYRILHCKRDIERIISEEYI